MVSILFQYNAGSLDRLMIIWRKETGVFISGGESAEVIAGCSQVECRDGGEKMTMTNKAIE